MKEKKRLNMCMFW